MYINKMVFIEKENISQDVYDLMVSREIIINTDYGTTEILSSKISELELENNEFTQIVKDSLGNDLFNLLASGNLDFVLIV